jgi:choice-of-anchor B domain-containing protein
MVILDPTESLFEVIYGFTTHLNNIFMRLLFRIFLACLSILETSTLSSAQSGLRNQIDFNLSLQSQVNDYPTDLYAACWHYVDGRGNEYAVLGTRGGTAIYLLRDPAKPRRVAFVPGARGTWREMKSYQDFIYIIADQGEDGIIIADMRSAPETITFRSVFPAVPAMNGNPATTIQAAHTLWIDEKGVLYLSGSRVNAGGVVMFDLKANPQNPVYLGKTRAVYTHDCFARGDTLWNADIFTGEVSVFDIKNKNNPRLLNTIPTTTAFTHSTWLSDNGKYLFTTDERPNSNVDAYDVSNVENIKLLDTYNAPATAGRGVIPHNVHYYQGFLVIAYYTDGVKIVDAHRPTNLIEVGSYDTFKGNDGGFEGSWGVSPYLPSGLIIASDITNGLFVLKPTYQRACYLEGSITDAQTGMPINGATVQLIAKQYNFDSSKPDGRYETGIAQSGTFKAVYSHFNYISDTVDVQLLNGQVTTKDVKLRRTGTTDINEKNLLPLNLSAAPNPFHDVLQITLSWNESAQDALLRVYDVNSRILESQVVQAGANTLEIGKNLLPGTYWVQVLSEGKVTRAVPVLKK